uniref:Uncharacterized protein n=1 Tax=Trichogramma kaykai TaxID=54128 RepID=A0ABD2X1J1_9HYME
MKSIKSSEHLRRVQETFITYHTISGEIPLPPKQEQFWGSPKNKINLQNYLRLLYAICSRTFNLEYLAFICRHHEAIELGGCWLRPPKHHLSQNIHLSTTD